LGYLKPLGRRILRRIPDEIAPFTDEVIIEFSEQVIDQLDDIIDPDNPFATCD